MVMKRRCIHGRTEAQTCQECAKLAQAEPELTEGEWLTSAEAARVLGVDRSTLSRYVIPYRQDRPAAWRRYRRADIEAYIAEHTVRPVRRARGLGDPR